jgi:hypothetical protein
MSLSNPEFDARIARIKSGKASSKSTLYVGLDEVYHISYPGRAKTTAAAASINSAIYPVLVVLALLAGALSCAIAAWVRFQAMGYSVGPGDVNTEMAIQIGSALAAAVALNLVLQFRARALRVAMAVGAVCSTFVFHNAVHIYPQAFATVFSPDWVEVVMDTTKPNSVLFRGRSYTF